MKIQFLSHLKVILLTFMLCSGVAVGAVSVLMNQTKQPQTQQKPANNTATTKPLPVEKPIDVSKLGNMVGIIPEYMPRPVPISVQVLVNNIFKINEQPSNYEASIDITLIWSDPAIAFDPTTVGTSILKFTDDKAQEQLKKIWNPEIVVNNMDPKPAMNQVGLFIHSDGTVIYVQRIKNNFHTYYNLRAFPFDKENLFVRLISTRYNMSDILFLQSNKDLDRSGVIDNISLDGWEVKNITFKSGNFRGWDNSLYPSFTASIGMKRLAFSHIFVFAPLLLIMLMPTILTLFLNADTEKQLGAWAGAMLALVAMTFTLNLRYPALPADSIVTQLLIICFGYQLFMMCLSTTIYNTRVTSKFNNPFITAEVISALRWVVPVGFITIIVTKLMFTALLGVGPK